GARMARCRLDGATLADDALHLGDADQLATLMRGGAAWWNWLHENRDVALDLPHDAARVKLVRTQHALAHAAKHTVFEGDAAQLEMLRSGVERWNAWRSGNPD